MRKVTICYIDGTRKVITRVSREKADEIADAAIGKGYVEAVYVRAAS